MSKKKNKIVLTLEEDFEFDTFGICSHHQDYRLAFELNQKLGLFLVKSEHDFVPDLKKGQGVPFSIYEYINEDLGAYYLIKNHSMGKTLIPEKPMMDYFLFINQLNGINEKEMIRSLNEIPVILGTYYFDNDDLPSVSTIHLDF